MATIASMQKCINLASKETRDKLPKSVQDALKTGRHDLVIAAVEAHEQRLIALQKEIASKYKEKRSETLKAFPAYQFTSRSTDPDNELNHFEPAGGLKLLVKNLVQRAGSVYHAAKRFAVFNRQERAIIEDFSFNFLPETSAAIDSIFQAKEGSSLSFRHEDMIQYFMDRQTLDTTKTLDPVVKEAIAATIYEWLGNEASRTSLGVQSQDSLRNLLGLPKDAILSKEALQSLGGLGTNTNELASSLGRTILNRLSLKAKDSAAATARERMESSLGLMAIAAMEQMQLVERQELYTKALDILKEGGSLGNQPVFFSKESGKTREGELLINSTVLRKENPGDTEPLHVIREIENRMNQSPEIFEKVFNNETGRLNYSFKKLPPRKTMRAGRSSLAIHKGQQNNLQKYMDTPWVASNHSMGAFEKMLALLDAEDATPEMQEAFDMIVGKESMEGKLEIRRKSVESVNRGIDRNIHNIRTLLQQMQEGGHKRFYIPNEFMNNMRMLMRGFINPQNSKIDRNLVAPESWKTEFTPNLQIRKFSNKEGIERSFLEAIAQALDIESGKVGGVNQQLDKLDTLLNHPGKLGASDQDKHYAILEAIMAFQEYDTTQTMLPQMMEAIARGVKATGMKLHGFKGLQEYARYLNYKAMPLAKRKNAPFVTDIYKEIDGVSNGPVISLLMFFSNAGSMQDKLAAVAMGGVSIARSEVNLDEKLGPAYKYLNDAYQRMGQSWAKEIELLKQEFTEKDEPFLRDKVEATEAILGPFHEEDGIVSKVVRNLSKPRTMQTSYGAGMKRQTHLFTEVDLLHDGIYKRMEKLIAEMQLHEGHPERPTNAELYEKLHTLLTNINTLLKDNERSRDVFKTDTYVNKDGTFDIEKLLAFKVEKKQVAVLEDSVINTYGRAMQAAIESVYQPLIEARKPFLAAVSASTALYNVLLDAKVNRLVETKIQKALGDLKAQKGGKLHPKDEEAIRKSPKYSTLTRAEVKHILEELEPVFPKIPTPLHTESSPSYLQLVSYGKQKKFVESAKKFGARVEQQYRSGTLVKQHGYPEGIPFLDSPGVSPIVRGVQMIDSMIANDLMGQEFDILNNHDGFSHAIGDSDAVGHATNKRFFDILQSYNLGKAIADMHESTMLAGQKMAVELGISTEVIFDALVDENVLNTHDLIEWAEDSKGLEKVAPQLYGILKELGYDKKAAFKAFLYDNDLSPKELVLAQLRKVRHDSANMATEISDNQAELVKHITRVAQYSNGGIGFDPDVTTQNMENDTLFGVNRDTVLEIDATKTHGIANHVASLAKEALGTQGSSADSQNISTDQHDYPNSEKVDALNVTQVFETMDAIDNAAGFGSVPISPNHKQHLTRVLDNIVAKVMKPVQLFRGTHNIDAETAGLYEVDGSKIWLQTQQMSTIPKSGMLGHGIRMSAAEVYVHELVHHVTYIGLKLSPYLRNQAYTLYEFARDAFEERYGSNAFQVFLNDRKEIYDMDQFLADPNNAHEILAAKERWRYVFEPQANADGNHPGLAEFLSIGLTNENFKRSLATLQLPQKAVKKAVFGIFEKNIQQSIVNLFNVVMDFIHTRFMKQEHSRQVDKELENLVRALSTVDTMAKTGVYSHFVKVSEKTAALSIRADEKVKEKVGKFMESRPVGKLWTNLQQLPEYNNFLSYQMRRALNWYGDKDGTETFLQAVVTEMKGATSRMRPLHELLNRRNRVLDAAKVEAAENIRNRINEWFDRELSSKEKTVYTEVGLKTDLSYLINRRTADTLKKLVANDQIREEEIGRLLLQLQEDPALRQHRYFFEKAADDLGYFMIHSAMRENGVVMMNAHNIVAMQNLHTVQKLQGEDFQRALAIVEELSTLMSLRYVPLADKRTMAYLMEENWAAFESVMHTHNLLKDEAFREAFHGKFGKMQKGYIKQILNDRIRYVEGTLQDREELTRMGYTMEETPITRDPNDPVRQDIYMFKSLTGMINDYQSGIASMNTNTKRGQDLFSLQKQIGNIVNPRAEGERQTEKMIGIIEHKLVQMYRSTPRKPSTHTGKTNFMVPHFDDNGNILGVRYMMNEHTKKTVLQQFGEVDAVLGAMASQNIDKKFTPIINAELVNALKDYYDGYSEKYPDDFVDISPVSSDPELREIYYRLPDKMRLTIKSVWGRDGMRVSRDMLTLAFGQNKYSIINFLQKESKHQKVLERALKEVMIFVLGWDNPFYKSGMSPYDEDSRSMLRSKYAGRAVIRAKRLEEFMTQVTHYAKSNIVVRNLKVIHGNYLSNIALLLSHGVPVHEVIKGAREAINSALAYQSLQQKHNQATTQLRILEQRTNISAADKATQIRALQRKITRLDYELANNTSKILIDAGLMPSIVDDVDTAHVASPYSYGLDKAMDTVLSKMPKPMEKATRVLFMTQDTEGFKMMNNAVKMTDYVGRYILYQHLTKRQGMSHADAVYTAIDKFINFDLPTHKSLEYLNSVGLVFFSKYQLRVLKHIKNVVKDAPFSAIAVYLLGQFSGIGDNIINSIPGFTKGLTQNLGTPLGVLEGSYKGILTMDLLGTVANATVK